MRVGLNATCFNDRPSGANQRFRGIYGTLIQQRPDIEFVIYEPIDQRIASWFGNASNVSARITPLPSVGRLARVRAGMGYWPRQLRQDRLDLFEAFHLPLVRARSCPTLLTIHDLRPVATGEPFMSRIMAGLVTHRALADADLVIAVSDAVAAEITSFHPRAKVATVYNGVDPASFSRPDAGAVEAVRSRFDVPEVYILTVGHLEGRKNLSMLVDAVALLRDAGTPRPLVIVGNDGGARDAVRARVALHNVGDLVTFVEGADDDEVRALYAGCTLLAFPSRYEGFGIPIVEAMAAGKPMVLADTPVFRELTVGQGVYFPVDDVDAAAAAIMRVWGNAAEGSRQAALSAARLRDFTFDRLAEQVARIYETLA